MHHIRDLSYVYIICRVHIIRNKDWEIRLCCDLQLHFNSFINFNITPPKLNHYNRHKPDICTKCIPRNSLIDCHKNKQLIFPGFPAALNKVILGNKTGLTESPTQFMLNPHISLHV